MLIVLNGIDTHHGPVAHVTNCTAQLLGSAVVIGILNQSQMARRAPNHARLNIEFRRIGPDSPVLVVTYGGLGGPRRPY